MEGLKNIERSLNGLKKGVLGQLMLNPPTRGLNSNVVEMFLNQSQAVYRELSTLLTTPNEKIVYSLRNIFTKIWDCFEDIKGLMNERSYILAKLRQ